MLTLDLIEPVLVSKEVPPLPLSVHVPSKYATLKSGKFEVLILLNETFSVCSVTLHSASFVVFCRYQCSTSLALFNGTLTLSGSLYFPI